MTSGEATGRDEEPARRSLDVAPTRLPGSGGGRARGVVALAAIGLVIAGAVGLAQMGNDGRRPAAVVAPAATAAPPASAAPTPLPAAAILDATPVRLRPAVLAAAVRDGSLDGRLVFVDGQLLVRSVDCDNLATVRRGCIDLAIPGLGVPVRAAERRLVWMSVPLGSWLVTVARGGSLVYLGSLVPVRQVPTGLAELEERMTAGPADGSRDPIGGTLFEANGTLFTGAPSPCSGTCPSEPPYLSAPRLVGDAADAPGSVVDVPADVPGIDPKADGLDGTFLVARTGDGNGWQVVARYVPSLAVRVLVP